MTALLTNKPVDSDPPSQNFENEQIECLAPPGVDFGNIGEILTQPKSVEVDPRQNRAQYEISAEIIGANPRNILHYNQEEKDLTVIIFH